MKRRLVSAGDSPPLPRRPETARPRSDAVDHEHVDAGAPTRDELEAIERKHIELTTHAGAEVVDDSSLGVAMVRSPRARAGAQLCGADPLGVG